MSTSVVVWFVYSRSTCNGKPANIHAAGSAEVVYVWRKPAAVVELPEIITGFMISSNNNCEYRSVLSTRIVMVKVA